MRKDIRPCVKDTPTIQSNNALYCSILILIKYEQIFIKQHLWVVQSDIKYYNIESVSIYKRNNNT